MDVNHFDQQDKELYQAILSLENETEVAAFCRDLMTLAEIKEFSKRWQIAKLLAEGKMSYLEIAKKIKTSTATVTRVNQWLNHGENGYKTALSRIK